ELLLLRRDEVELVPVRAVPVAAVVEPIAVHLVRDRMRDAAHPAREDLESSCVGEGAHAAALSGVGCWTSRRMRRFSADRRLFTRWVTASRCSGRTHARCRQPFSHTWSTCNPVGMGPCAMRYATRCA